MRTAPDLSGENRPVAAAFLSSIGLLSILAFLLLTADLKGAEPASAEGARTNPPVTGRNPFLVPRRGLPGSVVPPVTARSISGQFVVSGATGVAPRVGLLPEEKADLVDLELEPQWLAVAAERTKSTVLARLGATDAWVGKIHIYIRPRSELGDGPIRIVPVSFPNGWQYRLDVPDPVEWRRLVRALVEVVLLEMANREATGPVSVLPLWVNEGVTELVLADRGSGLVLRSHSAVLKNEQKPSLLAEARKRLEGRQPWTFGEMSFPEAKLTAEPGVLPMFQASACIFVHELLADDEGRRGFQHFLKTLPRSLNWQGPFLEGYKPRFLSVLDVEKWWAVSSLYLLGWDPAQVWSRDVALIQFRQVLQETAEVRSGTNGTPNRVTLTLSEVIQGWSPLVQRDVLRRKQEQVSVLLGHVPVDLVPLAVEFRSILDEYVAARFGTGGDTLRRSQPTATPTLAVARAVRRLRNLESKLANPKERKRSPPPAVAP